MANFWQEFRLFPCFMLLFRRVRVPCLKKKSMNEFKLCFARSILDVFYFRMSFIFYNSHIRLIVRQIQTRPN